MHESCQMTGLGTRATGLISDGIATLPELASPGSDCRRYSATAGIVQSEQ